jgi:hypothetical protein
MLVPAVILFSLCAADLLDRWKVRQVRIAWKTAWTVIFSLLAVLHASYNYRGTIYSWCNPSNNRYLNSIENLRALNQDGTALTVIVGVDALNQNIEYFGLGEYITVYYTAAKYKGDPGRAIEELDKKISARLTEKKRVFAERDLLNFKDFDFITQKYPGVNKEAVTGMLNGKYTVLPVRNEAGKLYFYELKLKAKK